MKKMYSIANDKEYGIVQGQESQNFKFADCLLIICTASNYLFTFFFYLRAFYYFYQVQKLKVFQVSCFNDSVKFRIYLVKLVIMFSTTCSE